MINKETNYVKADEYAVKCENMQDTLNEEMKQFIAIFENSPIGNLLIGQDRVIKHINRRIEEIFGYSAGELIGNKIDILINEHIREKHSNYCGNFFAKQVSRSMGIGMDLKGVKKDGSTVPLEIGLSFIKDKESVYVVASLIDITLRKKVEEELQKTRDEFVAMLTHDLKSPLTAIMGFSEILADKDSGELPADKIPYLNMMRQAGDMMLNIINNLVGATRIDAGKMVYNFENFPSGSGITIMSRW